VALEHGFLELRVVVELMEMRSPPAHPTWLLSSSACWGLGAAAYLSSEVGRNVSTGVARTGGVTNPALNANSLRRICGLTILVHEMRKGE
jgi:hypothetical protein